MAVLSNYSYLMRKEYGTSAFAKLIDVTSIPDIGGEPETIDITTLSDMKRRNMNGIQAGDSHTFNGWYTKEEYMALQTIMEADYEKADTELDTYQIWIGTNGAKGKFEWQGRLSVYITGYGVNEAVALTITISDEGEEGIHMIDDGPTPPPTPVVHVTGVTLDQNTMALDTVTTTTGTLTATVAPSNADDRSVSWSSSDTAVATVANGVVTAVAAGTATITVTTTDGGYTATCEVTVS